MNELDALRLMARHYPGGLSVLAVRIDKKEETLRKELSGDSKFKLGVVDALAISELAIEAQSEHCYAFVNAVAGDAGQMVTLPARDSADKQDVRTNMAGVLKECSDAFSVVTEALADEVISDNELRRIEVEVTELVARAQATIRAAQERHAAGKPSLRAA